MEKNKTTVSLKLSQKALRQLIWMQEELDVQSLADVIRSALKLQYLRLEKKDWKLLLKKGNRIQEVICYN